MSKLPNNTAGFMTAISELIETPVNGGTATVARFIFADDKPNGNKQGIPFSEFENMANSAIGMPVKIRFTGLDADNHEGSIPIGHIKSMETVTEADGSHKLIAEAMLWNQEFPEEVQWLKKAYAEGKAPGISWELVYKDSDLTEGIKWLKGVITTAATFVKRPAYGSRTSLLALASMKDDPDFTLESIPQITQKDLIALAEELKELSNPPKPPQKKGGNNMEEKELEALKAKAALAETLTTEVDTLKSTIEEKDKAIKDLSDKNEEFAKASLVESRIGKYTAAGFALETEAEKAEKRKALFASLTDDQFNDYIADLVATKAASGKATASLNLGGIPKLDPAPDSAGRESLRLGMRALARPNLAE